MKKWTSLLLACALPLCLAACSLNTIKDRLLPPPQSGEEPPGEVQAVEPAIPPAEPSVPLGPDAPAAPAPVPDGGGTPEVPEEGEPPKIELRVSHTDVSLRSAGETFRLSVWTSVDGGPPDSCAFLSADPSVAEVDKAGGEVTAVAPGLTTVAAQGEHGGEPFRFECIVRCRWTEDGPPAQGDAPARPSPGGAPARQSLSGFFSVLQSGYEGLGTMLAMEGELLDSYYPGLSSIGAVEEVLIRESALSLSNTAVGLVRLSDSATLEDALAVQGILQARIAAQAAGGAFYPESCETWGQGVVTSVSNYVGMFVCPGAARDMESLFVQTYGT